MNDGSSPGARLGFRSLAIEAFSFLDPLGFRVVREEDSIVRWESQLVSLSASMDPRDYEVDVQLGRRGRPERFSLDEIVRTLAPDRSDEVRSQVTAADALKRGLTRIAGVLADECKALLRGEDSAYEALAAAVDPERTARTMQAKFGPLLSKGDEAWERNERDRAAELYERAAPALDETRRRRLAYVRDKRGTG